LIYAQIIIIPSTTKTAKKMTDNPRKYEDKYERKSVRIRLPRQNRTGRGRRRVELTA
jgi:hypothetical protein